MAKPLYDSLCAFSASSPLRLHMPGHKGRAGGLFSELSQIDVTELAPTGNLYTGEGAITAAEALCARFAGARDALFFSCGSTQGIYTMLAAAVGLGGHLLLSRECHKSVYHAMGLLDITPHYLFSEPVPETSLPAPITEEQLKSALDLYPQVKAVFLTSPSYYGIITDLAPLAQLCHDRKVFLLVDQAHGAHFPAVCLPSAAAQGADLSVVSTHKTWPALGSSSVLYIGKKARFDRLRLKRISAIFGTTSPSFPILASIDYAREALEGADGGQYRRCAALTAAFREKINRETPFRALTPSDTISLDPCRLTVDTLIGGLSGFDADRLLQKHHIFVEMADERYLVMILTCRDGEETFRRLFDGLISLIPHCGAASHIPPLSPPPAPVFRCSIREAMFGETQFLPLRAAAGKISAEIVAPYPPGIPILAPGEEITEKHIAYLQKKSYNIDETIGAVSARSTL